MKISIVNILLPCFFLIHEMEEILMVPSWVKANSSVMYRSFPKFRYVIQNMERMTTWKLRQSLLMNLWWFQSVRL